jgi:hypothetical protein
LAIGAFYLYLAGLVDVQNPTFTPEEINHAKTLNDEYWTRAILLTARELEP